MYPRDLIETLRSRVNVVRLIGEVIPLKRSGRNFVGLCPFHGEKTPSFSVSDEKQLYHCFGCGVGGTVYQFMMQYHQLTFKEAVEKLAAYAGMDISAYNAIPDSKYQGLKEKKERLLSLALYAAEKYRHAFMHAAMAKPARDYAAKRKLNEVTLAHWGIGYAPEGWDHLAKALDRDQKSAEDALELGLIAKSRDKGFFDIFRSRLIFPIRDVSGHVIGFGGRALGDVKPKYLNSTQSMLFDKGHTLYGLYEAKDTLRTEKNLIVVEGYMDLLALYQAGYTNVVATLGTALTVNHATLIKKYADKVTLLFDGDTAGKKAAIRSLKPLLSQGLTVNVVFIPDALDPDEFLDKFGRDKLQELIVESPRLLDFFIENFYLKTTDVSVKSRALETLAEVVKETPYVFVREALIHEISQKAKLSSESLLGGKVKPVETCTRTVAKLKKEESGTHAEVFTLLRLSQEVGGMSEKILQDTSLRQLLTPAIVENIETWLQDVEQIKKQDYSPASLVDLWPAENDRPVFTKVLLEEFPEFQTKWEQIWEDCLKGLHNKKIKSLRVELARAEEQSRLEDVETLTKQVQQLKTFNSVKRINNK